MHTQIVTLNLNPTHLISKIRKEITCPLLIEYETGASLDENINKDILYPLTRKRRGQKKWIHRNIITGRVIDIAWGPLSTSSYSE